MFAATPRLQLFFPAVVCVPLIQLAPWSTSIRAFVWVPTIFPPDCTVPCMLVSPPTCICMNRLVDSYWVCCR